MRLGGPVNASHGSPDEWVALVRSRGYRAAQSPVRTDADAETVRAYRRAAEMADIVIAEVGAWSNPMSSDEQTRQEAFETCVRSLDLAERLGARCCVNIAGSRGVFWHGPDEKDLTAETFDMIVDTVRSIIDEVQPGGTYYALETMPWLFPDSADSYLDLLRAVDRPQFGVHFDPVNIICSPRLYFASGDMIRDFVEKLGPNIRSCHAKDILLAEKLTVHLDEVRPGMGRLDYETFLSEMEAVDVEMPLMIEHLRSEREYASAARYIRDVAERADVTL